MFFVFAFVPEGTGVIKGIAFALAIGVAFDAFLVRMTLVPAAMVGRRGAWWLPRWLARILPDVDIEGEGLRAHLAESERAAERDADVLADDLLVGDPADPVGPVSIAVPRGGALVARPPGRALRPRPAGDARRARAARRRPPRGGLRPAAAHDAAAVMQRVAIADAATDGGTAGTAGELVAARVDATCPWYRLGSTRAAVAPALRHVAEARTAVADPPRGVHARHRSGHAARPRSIRSTGCSSRSPPRSPRALARSSSTSAPRTRTPTAHGRRSHDSCPPGWS